MKDAPLTVGLLHTEECGDLLLRTMSAACFARKIVNDVTLFLWLGPLPCNAVLGSKK